MLDLRGKAALVTGASAGIGREMARILARDVATLVLVARRRERLDELATELRAARPELRVEVRAVDLQNRDESGAVIDALERDGIAIDVFINNAGFGDYGVFERRGWTKLEEMLELNVVSATYLLHKIVPLMVGRGSGAILNVGSVAGVFPSPGMGVYAASKAYVNHLTECLRAELGGTGVSITLLAPGPVPTEFQEVAGTEARAPLPKIMTVDAVTCATEAIEGLKRGDARVIPGGPLRAFVLSGEATPKALIRPVLARMAAKLRGR